MIYICSINLNKIIMAYILENKNVHYRTLDSGLTVIREGLVTDCNWMNCENATIVVDGSLRIESNNFYEEATAYYLYWGYDFERIVNIDLSYFAINHPEWSYNPNDVKINNIPSTWHDRPIEDFFKFGKIYEYKYLERNAKLRKNLNQKFVEFSHWKLHINQ